MLLQPSNKIIQVRPSTVSSLPLQKKSDLTSYNKNVVQYDIKFKIDEMALWIFSRHFETASSIHVNAETRLFLLCNWIYKLF